MDAPHSSRTSALILAAAVALTALSGCNLQKFTVGTTADVLYPGSLAIERESDPYFAREAMPASLKTLETFLISDPENDKLLEMLGKGYFTYAFGFMEWDLERGQYSMAGDAELELANRRAVHHYLRARDYGLQLLDKPALEEAARSRNVEALDAELKKLKKKDVPGLFWAGYGWGGAINLSQADPEMVASLSVVEQMMNRVLELDDDYFYGGVHVFFGVFFASRPEMAGGDPEKAKMHFDKAIEKHDGNMMARYLMARYYAPTQQDRELFVSMLEQVANADVRDNENLRLNNEIARERAIFWLKRVDELIYE